MSGPRGARAAARRDTADLTPPPPIRLNRHARRQRAALVRGKRRRGCDPVAAGVTEALAALWAVVREGAAPDWAANNKLQCLIYRTHCRLLRETAAP